MRRRAYAISALVSLSRAQRHYVLVEQGIGAGIVNFALNAAIAYLTFCQLEQVPLWGEQSIAGDTIGTTVLLPLLTCLIVTRLAHGRVRAGRLAPLTWTRASHPLLRWLPRGTFRRGLVLALVCTVALAPLFLIGLGALGVTSLSLSQFVVLKASFAAAAGVLVTPVVTLAALAGEE
jgi:hypothetical protein